ncbi:uncharacterized protein LOC132789334 [Drosophila nasuta]|uniref:uncharacterized protein LOC132789334 n=1 Tax=Drosophila nasuta TaxID=42062 RepID=UPI00295E7585|nr:uncharacterized protein LOC132789334 [Drosophila nasuta]
MTCPQTLKTFQLTVTSGNILRVTGFKCRVVDPSFCYYERCVIKAISRNVKEFNVVVRLLQKPVNNVTVRLEIVRRLAASTQPIYQFEIDGCQFMVSKRRNPFAKAIFKFLRIESFSNLNHSCPFDHDIIISHLELQKELGAGIMIGKGDYVINANWLAYNVLRFITTATLEVTD